MAISLVLVDDHALVRSALSVALGQSEGLRVAGVAGTVEEALDQLARCRPDVALVDLRLAGRSALDHLPELVLASPRTRLLALTAWPSAPGLDRILAGGARGLLSKAQPLAELVEAVRRAHAGEIVVDPALVGALVHEATGVRDERPAPRDLEVLALLAEGRGTAAIAESLHVSEDAVRNRIRDCLSKLGAHNRVGAVREATRRGWLLPVEPSLGAAAGRP